MLLHGEQLEKSPNVSLWSPHIYVLFAHIISLFLTDTCTHVRARLDETNSIGKEIGFPCTDPKFAQ